MDTSYVYLIGQIGAPEVKIGKALDPTGRLNALQTANPRELVLLWQSTGGSVLELALHMHLAPFHVRGEWFDLGPDPVAAVSQSARWVLRPGPGGFRATAARALRNRAATEGKLRELRRELTSLDAARIKDLRSRDGSETTDRWIEERQAARGPRMAELRVAMDA